MTFPREGTFTSSHFFASTDVRGRRVLETAFEKVLRRVLRRCLGVGFRGRKGSEKGS